MSFWIKIFTIKLVFSEKDGTQIVLEEKYSLLWS